MTKKKYLIFMTIILAAIAILFGIYSGNFSSKYLFDSSTGKVVDGRQAIFKRLEELPSDEVRYDLINHMSNSLTTEEIQGYYNFIQSLNN